MRRYGTVEDVRKSYFGLSARQVRELCRRGQLPHRRPAHTRKLLFDLDEVERFLDTGGELELTELEGGGRICRLVEKT
jgi:hypothetical protein